MPGFRDGLAGVLAKSENLGYSPEQMRDWERRLGGLDPLMREVQSARAGEVGARQELLDLTPNERAALDRYTNFARLAEQSPAQVPGGLLLMGISELLKAGQPLQSAASDIWRRVTGQPQAADFFGGRDVSRPSLQNITSAIYGAQRGFLGR